MANGDTVTQPAIFVPDSADPTEKTCPFTGVKCARRDCVMWVEIDEVGTCTLRAGAMTLVQMRDADRRAAFAVLQQ